MANIVTRLIGKLGSGGMADVFLGVQIGDDDFKRLVVVKRIHTKWLKDENAKQMFLNEARTVALLNHPNIASIYDLNRHRDDISITMQYVDGENLRLILRMLKKKGKKFPLRIACSLILQAAEALHYAHFATTPEGRPLHLVHRDIDTQNLMLDSNGYLKIIDFGIAKSNIQSELTSPGMIKGKLSYIAPDVFVCKDIDHRVDVYSLGLVFFGLITGKMAHPFKSDVSLAEVINEIIKTEIPAPSSINPALPRDLDEVIAKAIHKDRKQRYQTAEDFADAIRDFAENHGGLPSTAEVKNWFHSEFKERVLKRRKFERQAIKKAIALLNQDFLNQEMLVGTISPSSGETPLTIDRPRPPSQLDQISQLSPERRTNPWLFLSFLFLLIFAGAFLFRYLFWAKPKSPDQDDHSPAALTAASEPVSAPTSPNRIVVDSHANQDDSASSDEEKKVEEPAVSNAPPPGKKKASISRHRGKRRTKAIRRKSPRKSRIEAAPSKKPLETEKEALATEKREDHTTEHTRVSRTPTTSRGAISSETPQESSRAAPPEKKIAMVTEGSFEKDRPKDSQKTYQAGTPSKASKEKRLSKRERPREKRGKVPKAKKSPPVSKPKPKSLDRNVAQIREKLAKLLMKLSPKVRQVVVLNKVKGYSINKIARITNTSTETVRKRLNMGLDELRKHILSDPSLDMFKSWIKSRGQ